MMCRNDKSGVGPRWKYNITQTPIPWQVAKRKIEEYTTFKWKHKWTTSPQYKHTKLFYSSPNKNKSKYILKMGTYMLSTWIKSITGHNNLAYFQSKLNPEIDPTCRLCLQANETLHHLTVRPPPHYN